MPIQFLSLKDYEDISLRTSVSVFVEPSLLEELCPKEYKKLIYLLKLYDISGATLVGIYRFGGKGHTEELAEQYDKVLYAIEVLKQETRDYFGEIKIGKFPGSMGSMFYVDYNPSLVDDYAKYNMKVIPSIEEI